MKIFAPVVIGVILLAVTSAIVGFMFGASISLLAYSAWFYLALCFAQMAHSIEEYFTQFWDHIGKALIFTLLKRLRRGTPLMLDRSFFILFNIALNVVMFVYFFPINASVLWAWFFGVGMAIVGIGNGILHCGTALMQWKYYSGCITGILTLVFGSVVLGSLIFH